MFEEIARDSTSGATGLSVRAALILSEAAESFEGPDAGSFWDSLFAACEELISAGRDMAPIVNLVGRVLSSAERTVLSGKTAETALHAVQLECSVVSQFAEERLRDLGELASGLIEAGSTVATLSDGESVRSTLRAAAAEDRSFEMLVSESRPNLEGIELARFAGGLGLKTTVVADAALPGLVSSCGLVLLGADSISEESFVAKIGAYPLALAAREAGVPCSVVAATDKLLPAALRADPGRPRPAEELLAPVPDNVSVRNRYFEDVPVGLIRTLVTEEGERQPGELREMLMTRPVAPALLQLLYPSGPRE